MVDRFRDSKKGDSWSWLRSPRKSISEALDKLLLDSSPPPRHSGRRYRDTGSSSTRQQDQRYGEGGSSSSRKHRRHYGDTTVNGTGLTILGDFHNHEPLPDPVSDLEDVVEIGLCLGSAPRIPTDQLVGRVAEIEEMSRALQPGRPSNEQRRVVLGGMGGVGKTQLALVFAQQYQQHYKSVFWLNATSQSTLHASWRLLAGHVVPASELEKLSSAQVLAKVHKWLLSSRNTQWLLIFDNYDEPDIWDIEPYCPYAAHGSIITTTRLPDLVSISGHRIRLQPLVNIEHSLSILQKRSRRENVRNDPDAQRLARRLGGLPLALATAGAYMNRSPAVSFQQYLQAYEQRWDIDPRRPTQLQEYQDRTLYTTWNLSYSRLKKDDPEAAQMLKLLAYFDNQDVYFELFRAVKPRRVLGRFQSSLTDPILFGSIMSTLVDYCLVEVQSSTGSYSIHNCVHDWTLGKLNRVIDLELYWYAFDCVKSCVKWEDEGRFSEIRYNRISRHAVRLTHDRFLPNDTPHSLTSKRLEKMSLLALLLCRQSQFSAAERMYVSTLVGVEKLFGTDAIRTISVVNDLGLLHISQGELNKAEQMLGRALAVYERELGPDHTYTLTTVHNLGNLYVEQGRLEETEQMLRRVLVGYERALGPDHHETLFTIHNLGVLYLEQGRLEEAEQMLARALAGQESILRPDHTRTLATINDLGYLYLAQGRLEEAEQMLERTLAGTEKALGPDHSETLITIENLASLYHKQGKLDQAELMYKRALAVYERELGPDHTNTLRLLNNLGSLYLD